MIGALTLLLVSTLFLMFHEFSRLSCLFWKPKNKSFSKNKENQNIQNNYVETAGPIIEGNRKYMCTVESQTVLPLYFTKADSLNQGTVYFERFSGKKSLTKKVKSYPVSPRRISLEDKGYLSHQNLHTMSKYNLHSKYSNLESSASTQQNSSNYKPRATLGSIEPFPFQVPKDIAPRQSLFYELRYGDTDNSEINDNNKYEAEKPMEDYNNPNNSRRNVIENQNNDSNIRRSILHVRPVSVQRTPRESMKPMTLQADTSVKGRNKSYVHHFQYKPNNKTALLMTNEGKVLHPLQTDKVQTSFARSKNEIPPVRVSVVQPIEPLVHEGAIPIIPSRRSFRRSSIQHSPVMYRDVEAEEKNRLSLLSEREASYSVVEDGEDLKIFPVMAPRKSIRKSSVHLARVSKENNAESSSFPFAQTENEPVVYAVPVVPTRGRSKSLLQQSVKALASTNRKEEPVIYRKNIRYSMDTDVFSAETRQRNVSTASPGFVNMERGQPMLVSEVLNPITSLFISDLKNPVPKDPIKKPKEANVWVKPRRYSVHRNSLSKQPYKPVTRVQATAREISGPTTRTVPVQRRLSRKSFYKYKEESSSSDESIVVYRKKPKQTPRRSYQQAVYAAKMPNPILPHHDYRNSLQYPQKSEHQVNMAQTTSSNDICGLNLGSDQRIFENLQSPYYVKMVSSAQQTDIEDDLDLVCYPSESVLKKSVVPSESGSKLRWRIIIKRGEEK